MRSPMDCKQDPNVTELFDAEAKQAGKTPSRKGRKLNMPEYNDSKMFLNEELAEGEESELDFEGYRVERED
jgi:hypothetical protein